MSGAEELSLLAALAASDGAATGAAAGGGAALGAGAAGAAGAGAASAAGSTAGMTAAEIAAEEAAKQAAMQTAMQSGGLMSTAPGPGVVASGMQYPAMADTALINSGNAGMAGGKMTGLLAQGAGSPATKFAARQGAMSLMNQPQQSQARPMTYQQPDQQAVQMYGGGGGMYGMETEEEKRRRLRAMGYRV